MEALSESVCAQKNWKKNKTKLHAKDCDRGEKCSCSTTTKKTKEKNIFGCIFASIFVWFSSIDGIFSVHLSAFCRPKMIIYRCAREHWSLSTLVCALRINKLRITSYSMVELQSPYFVVWKRLRVRLVYVPKTEQTSCERDEMKRKINATQRHNEKMNFEWSNLANKKFAQTDEKKKNNEKLKKRKWLAALISADFNFISLRLSAIWAIAQCLPSHTTNKQTKKKSILFSFIHAITIELALTVKKAVSKLGQAYN